MLQQLAQLEAQALKARTDAQIQADMAKAKQNMDIKQAEAKQDPRYRTSKIKC